MNFSLKHPFCGFKKSCIRTLWLVFILLLSAPSLFAQLKFNFQNQPIRTVLKKIEKEAGVRFFYNSDLATLDKQVSLNTNASSVSEVLEKLFDKTDLTFRKEADNFYVITVKGKATKPESQNDGKVKGVVTDTKGETIVGANILVKGTLKGATTDINGRFAIDATGGTTLVVSFLGYLTEEVNIQGKNSIAVTLSEANRKIDEVVVVGFGTQKKVNLTGAVASISMEQTLGNRPVTNVMNALQGAVPGLVITGGSSPGQSKDFNIRGITSINGGGPLVLVDNVPAQVDMINPEDIENVTVLKDAASAAIYGARAAFGVILITTKKAARNSRLQISYDNNFGFQKSINRPQQADIIDILKAYKDAQFTGGKWYAQSQDVDQWINFINQYRTDPSQLKGVTENGIYIPEENNPSKIRYYLKQTDLYQNMLDDFGFLQSHNVSAMGGSEKISYRTSLGYNNNQGILITDKDSYKRISLSTYVSGDINKWIKTSIDVKYAKGTKSEVSNGNLWDLRLANFIPEGKALSGNGNLLPMNTPANFILNSYPTVSTTENPRIFSQTTLTPFKGAEMIFEYTFDKTAYDYKQYDKPFTSTSVQLEERRTPLTSQYFNTKQQVDYNSINTYGTYSFALNEIHNFKIMAGYSQEWRRSEVLKVDKKEMINEEMPSFTGAFGETKATDEYKEYSIRSGFYRLNYNLLNRYLLEVNGRYDGSSKFPHNTRFGIFPSFSLGWQLADEPFMTWSKPYLNALKMRVSWGKIGNQSVDEYGFIPFMNSPLANWINPSTGLRPTTLDIPELVRTNFTWEKVTTLDFGVDASLFASRLQASFDWYKRDTKGMLAPGMEFPAVVGTSAPVQNAADLSTKGWELSLNWRDKIGDWSYSVGINLYDAMSEITKFDNVAGLFGKDSQNKDIYRTGMKLGEIWGYVTDGFYTIDDFVNTQTWTLKDGVTSIKGYAVKPGDVKFKNLLDAEGSVVNQIDAGNSTTSNPGDRQIIGNSTARYQFGSTFSVGWKGIDLFAMLQGTGKRDVWISDELRWPFASGNFGTLFENQRSYWQPTDALNGNWTPVNPNPEFFRIYGENGNSGSNRRVQTKYLLNGAYLRIKNVTLSYNLPVAWASKISLKKVRVFVSGENLYTFDHLPKGYDPERVSWQYPFYRTISFGINLTM